MYKQQGISLIEMMVALLLGSIVISVAVTLYTRFNHSAEFAEGKLNVARKVAVGLQLLVGDLQKLQHISPLNCPDVNLTNETGAEVLGVDEANRELVKIYKADDAVLKQLDITALPGTQALLAYIPEGDLNYLMLTAKPADYTLRLDHAEGIQSVLWLLANCQFKVLLAGQAYKSNISLNHRIDHDIVAGATVWPLELRVFYIAKTSQSENALFVRDSAGRHELVEGVNNLQLSYGLIHSGQLIWDDVLLPKASLALIKISLSASDQLGFVSREREVAL